MACDTHPHRRAVSVWLPRLTTDWFLHRRPELENRPFALTASEHGRMIIAAASAAAEACGIFAGQSLADARALEPRLIPLEDKPGLAGELLSAMAEWCLRYTPDVGIAPPDGLVLDITGCAHLRGGERPLLKDLVTRFAGFGYGARAALADTPGAAWAVARFGREQPIIPPDGSRAALAPLPPQALRLPAETVITLRRLGLHSIGHLCRLPRAALNRRFGEMVSLRLAQALGEVHENFVHVRPPPDYAARLAFPEGIATREALDRALEKLLALLCRQLETAGKGLRRAELKGFRLDGRVATVAVGTGAPSRAPKHLLRLFAERLPGFDPGPGVELLLLSAEKTEPVAAGQPALEGLRAGEGPDPAAVAELLDRLDLRLGPDRLWRLAPQESHWPERAARRIKASEEKPAESWPRDRPRPVHLLARPELVEVMAPVPDDPPVLFRHKGALHRLRRAEGPERIEAEWWRGKDIADIFAPAAARDYYRVEDEDGRRYWLFRAGPYAPDRPSRWFLHGFFG